MRSGSAGNNSADIRHECCKGERDGDAAQTLFVRQGIHAFNRLTSRVRCRVARSVQEVGLERFVKALV